MLRILYRCARCYETKVVLWTFDKIWFSKIWNLENSKTNQLICCLDSVVQSYPILKTFDTFLSFYFQGLSMLSCCISPNALVFQYAKFPLIGKRLMVSIWNRGANHWFFFIHLPQNHNKSHTKITKSHKKSQKNHKNHVRYFDKWFAPRMEPYGIRSLSFQGSNISGIQFLIKFQQPRISSKSKFW